MQTHYLRWEDFFSDVRTCNGSVSLPLNAPDLLAWAISCRDTKTKAVPWQCGERCLKDSWKGWRGGVTLWWTAGMCSVCCIMVHWSPYSLCYVFNRFVAVQLPWPPRLLSLKLNTRGSLSEPCCHAQLVIKKHCSVKMKWATFEIQQWEQSPWGSVA